MFLEHSLQFLVTPVSTGSRLPNSVWKTMHWLGLVRTKVTFHPLSRVSPQGADPAPEILSLLPQSYQANTRAFILTLRMQEWHSLQPRSWTAEWAGIWLGFFTGYCCLQHGIFVAKGCGRRLGAALVKPEREREGMGSIKREGAGQERSIFARLQLYSSFRGQEWGSLRSKTTEVWQAGIPLALLSACRQAAQFLWHRIAAVSWWRSFQSLGFPVLSWQQLLSRSCWNPFSHSVNATHRKVGCSHQSPSLSLLDLIDWE